MNSPAFWNSRTALTGRLLAPLGWIYAGTTAWRLAHSRPWQAPVPVICVGNLTAGGSGKTPVVRDLGIRLQELGLKPGILSRGYGGAERGPLKIDPGRHNAAQVGDEPLMLARDIPCWIAADRADGARAMIADGVGVIVMDDGLQNPTLVQDLKLVVVDGEVGFGNGRAIPAGPLRETLQSGIARADALIVVGRDKQNLTGTYSNNLNVLHADTELISEGDLPLGRLVAFAGIGRPDKFRASLIAKNAEIAAFHEFADHHPYSENELAALSEEAAALRARLVTTEKDWVRLNSTWRRKISQIEILLSWDNEDALSSLLNRVMRHD
jgi:tetraacyldisaccharide 4'-kinase